MQYKYSQFRETNQEEFLEYAIEKIVKFNIQLLWSPQNSEIDLSNFNKIEK